MGWDGQEPSEPENVASKSARKNKMKLTRTLLAYGPTYPVLPSHEGLDRRLLWEVDRVYRLEEIHHGDLPDLERETPGCSLYDGGSSRKTHKHNFGTCERGIILQSVGAHEVGLDRFVAAPKIFLSTQSDAAQLSGRPPHRAPSVRGQQGQQLRHALLIQLEVVVHQETTDICGF